VGRRLRADRAELWHLMDDLSRTAKEMSNTTAQLGSDAGVGRPPGASSLHATEGQPAKPSLGLPPAGVAIPSGTAAGEAGKLQTMAPTTRAPSPTSTAAQPSTVAPTSTAAPTRDPDSCPDNADIQVCARWCQQVSPGSSATLGGRPCSQLAHKDMVYGMFPQCRCYDSSLSNVLHKCTSTCLSQGGARVGDLMQNAMEGAALATTARKESPVVVSVFYSTRCSACRGFVENGLTALARAGLPGSAVNVSMLPINFGPKVPAQLCAMEQTHLRCRRGPPQKGHRFLGLRPCPSW